MSHTFTPTIPGTRRLLLAAALVTAMATGAVGAQLVDRYFDAPVASAVGTAPHAMERARYDAYIEWLENRAHDARAEARLRVPGAPAGSRPSTAATRRPW